jgi:hypothetical protein
MTRWCPIGMGFGGGERGEGVLPIDGARRKIFYF